MLLEDLSVTAFTDPATIRLISTAYIDEPALSPLVEDKADLEFLEALEGATSARQTRCVPLPVDIDPRELLTERDGYGWSYINAAFCYTRPTGNRFNGPNRGAWYACFGKNGVQTAQSEVAYHLGRELEATGVYENITRYRELIAGFTGDFYDLRETAKADVLNPDVTVGYPAGQVLAQSIFRQGGNGILYPSVRHIGGYCLAAVRPRLVQNVRQGETWCFEWAGTLKPYISNAK